MEKGNPTENPSIQVKSPGMWAVGKTQQQQLIDEEEKKTADHIREESLGELG